MDNPALNLPKCELKGLINHIYDQEIYKEEDLKILKLRLIHSYGEKNLQQVWKPAMKLLGRKI